MQSKFWRIIARMRILMREDGQDLVEYALVVALIAFSAVAAEKALAGGISNSFTKISTTLTSTIT